MRKLFRASCPLFFLILLGFVVYLNSLPNSFHFDDDPTIVQNGAIRSLERIPSYFTDTTTWTVSRLRDWRPIVLITFALNYWMGGLNPAVFRLFNLALHVGNAFLLFLIFRDIAARKPAGLSFLSANAAKWLGLLAGALFLVHTANSEVVNYIFARSTLQATFFYLLSFYCYLRGPFSGKENPSRLWHPAALLVFILALGSKGVAISLPLSLLFFELIFLNPNRYSAWQLYRQEPRRLNKYIPLALTCIGYIIVRQLLSPQTLMGLVRPRRMTSFVYFLTQLRAWVYYIGLSLWPHPLISDYVGFGWSYSIWDAQVLRSLAVVLFILGIGLYLRSRQPAISFFIFWYFITLLPEASIIPLSDAVNGYRLYPSNIGFCIIAVIGAALFGHWLFGNKGGQVAWHRFSIVLATIGVTAVSVLSAATIERNKVWRDDGTLWSDVLTKDPSNPRAYMGLGGYLLDQQDYRRAHELFEKAVQLSPRNGFPYLFRGYSHYLMNRYPEALQDYNLSLKYDRRDPYVFFLRGDLYKKLGQYDKALTDYEAALRLRPLYADVYLAKSQVLQEMGEIDKAIEACQEANQIDPEEPAFYTCLGRLLAKQKRSAEALRVLQRGATLGLEDHDLWYELGLAYERAGRFAEAAEAFNSAGLSIKRNSEQARPHLHPTGAAD